MSNALTRRNSSKQGLQNLMRLTAQRSIEDAEEVERERRRRVREASCRRNSDSAPAEENDMYDFKPSSSPSLEEDEGFSDWTQRRERRRQQRLQEVVHIGGEDKEDEEERNSANKASLENTSITASRRLMQDDDDDDEDVQAEGRQQVQVASTSEVFLVQDPKHSSTDADQQEVTSSPKNQSKKPSRSSEHGESEAERHLEKIRRGLQEKEIQEAEQQLRRRQAEAEREQEELKRRREQRRHVREEAEQHREEEKEQQRRISKEEEERRRMREDTERRRMDTAERTKSMSEHDADEAFSPFGPKTPTHKISERTESLSRSLKKSNSFKKTQALVLVSKIDDKMEKYAHAVENSQEPRGAKAPMVDMPNSLEAVTSKKNLFEGGEAWTSSPTKATASKDTEGIKVGVANMITQWVKGQSDSSRPAQSRPADLRCGDVMQKKNMWEIIGESSGKPGQHVKGSAANTKYKFVVTGHGKYEKILVGGHGGDGTNAESDLYQSDY
uniref:caldesmon, smooth muscle n=1 Tax=Doryrhamphus excisus TaxID=161450 RepID=UPI0025ADC7E7|nr:caldesmon, smooth muscle [Doryrhamphus excisus]XP_057931642.1 caldesmon, smooth muscle [Doryrhamphus excisus]XP_057931643.1 caldesmon, smooth muscle [Doryrhamphus excisus]